MDSELATTVSAYVALRFFVLAGAAAALFYVSRQRTRLPRLARIVKAVRR